MNKLVRERKFLLDGIVAPLTSIALAFMVSATFPSMRIEWYWWAALSVLVFAASRVQNLVALRNLERWEVRPEGGALLAAALKDVLGYPYWSFLVLPLAFFVGGALLVLLASLASGDAVVREALAITAVGGLVLGSVAGLALTILVQRELRPIVEELVRQLPVDQAIPMRVGVMPKLVAAVSVSTVVSLFAVAFFADQSVQTELRGLAVEAMENIRPRFDSVYARLESGAARESLDDESAPQLGLFAVYSAGRTLIARTQGTASARLGDSEWAFIESELKRLPEVRSVDKLQGRTAALPKSVYRARRLSNGDIYLWMWTGFENVRVPIILATLVGMATMLLLGFTLSYGAARNVLQPLAKLQSTAKRVARGDLTVRALPVTDDEVGELSRTMGEMIAALATIAHRIEDSGQKVTEIVETIQQGAHGVVTGSESQSALIDETATSIGQMNKVMQDIAANVDELAIKAVESSTAVLEMNTLSREMSHNGEILAGSADETTASITAMARSVSEVSRHVAGLAESARETVGAIAQIDGVVGVVQNHSRTTNTLASRVADNAEIGAESMALTIEGIGDIKFLTDEARRAIHVLGERIRSITKILTVIDEIASRTKLLALNAAILAAQAGEQGLGFAVVAEEIKALAQRTGRSTSEIADLIRAVQQDAENAVDAMELGAKSVEKGVKLAATADDALTEILGTSRASKEAAEAIASALGSLVRSSVNVRTSVERIQSKTDEIANQMRAQERNAGQITAAAQGVRNVARQLSRSTDEQSQSGAAVARNMDRIAESVTSINRSIGETTKGSEMIGRAADDVKALAKRNYEGAMGFDRDLEVLRVHMASLVQEVARFQTGNGADLPPPVPAPTALALVPGRRTT